MARVLFLLIMAPNFSFTSGQLELACSTPNGGDGTCKLFHQCPLVMEIIKKLYKTQHDLDLLKKYHCGLEGTTPKACCPDMCITPDNKRGQCVSILSCPSLARLMKPPLLEHVELFVLSSKCTSTQEYSVCCPLEASTVPTVDCSALDTYFPPDPRTGCCGVDTVMRRDAASLPGVKVSAHTMVEQYPWMVLIEYVKEDKISTPCLGSLISRKYVLTTVYCVKGDATLRIGKPTSVRLGEYDTNNEGADCTRDKTGAIRCTEGIVRIRIEKTLPHPAFKKNPAISDDIALLKLEREAPYTDFIRPICLPNKDVTVNPHENLVFYAAGWGATTKDSRASNVKLQVDLPFVNKDQCQGVFLRLTYGQICAGGVRGKDTCRGDTGGPLMYHNGYNYEAAGVTSFGLLNCGQSGYPGVYTNVFEYLPWIMSTIHIDSILSDEIK